MACHSSSLCSRQPIIPLLLLQTQQLLLGHTVSNLSARLPLFTIYAAFVSTQFRWHVIHLPSAPAKQLYPLPFLQTLQLLLGHTVSYLDTRLSLFTIYAAFVSTQFRWHVIHLPSAPSRQFFSVFSIATNSATWYNLVCECDARSRLVILGIGFCPPPLLFDLGEVPKGLQTVFSIFRACKSCKTHHYNR